MMDFKTQRGGLETDVLVVLLKSGVKGGRLKSFTVLGWLSDWVHYLLVYHRFILVIC